MEPEMQTPTDKAVREEARSRSGDPLVSRWRRMAPGKVLAVGVGNPMRGDDAAGLELARLLAEREACEVIIAEDVPENYLGPMLQSEAQTVIFCDAVDLREQPGAFALLDLDELAGPSLSTHNASLRLLARCLRQSGVRSVLIAAVQPQSTAWGGALSPTVRAGVASLADLLAEALQAGGGER